MSKDYSLNAIYEDEATGNKFLVLQAGVLYNMTLVKTDDTEKEYELGKEGYESSIIGTLDTTTGTLTVSADGDSADGVKMRDYESGTDENGSYYSTSPIYIDRSAINKIVFEDKIVTNFGNGVFIDCFNLTTVEIPASVKNIGDYAFAGCGV